MATAMQTALNRTAGLSRKSDKERERRLRLAHANKSRGQASSARDEADPPKTEQD